MSQEATKGIREKMERRLTSMDSVKERKTTNASDFISDSESNQEKNFFLGIPNEIAIEKVIFFPFRC